MACGTILNSVSRSKQLMSASWWVFAVAKRLLLERHGSLLMFELRVCAVKILEELQWLFPVRELFWVVSCRDHLH